MLRSRSAVLRRADGSLDRSEVHHARGRHVSGGMPGLPIHVGPASRRNAALNQTRGRAFIRARRIWIGWVVALLACGGDTTGGGSVDGGSSGGGAGGGS